MHSALASLGIVYAVRSRRCLRCGADQIQDDEIENLYGQLENEFGAVTFEAWLALLVGPPYSVIFRSA